MTRHRFVLSSAIAAAILLGPAGVLAQGILHNGEVSCRGITRSEAHDWFIDGEKDDVIFLRLGTSSSGPTGRFSVAAELYGPDLLADPLLVISGVYNGTFKLPLTARYTLKVHDNSFYYEGSYCVALEWVCPLNKQEAKLIQCGQRIDKTVSYVEQDFYNFVGHKGDRINLVLWTTWSGSNGRFSARADLYGPDPCLDPIKSGLSGVNTIDLDADGTYTIRIYDYNFWYDGTYSLTIQGIVPSCDCNGNGSPDDTDIADGTSLDENGNLLPDECEDVAWVRIEKAEPNAAKVLLNHTLPVRGGELAMAYATSILEVLQDGDILPGADLPAGAMVYKDLAPVVGACLPAGIADKGFTVGWINSETKDVVLAAGVHEILKIQYKPKAGIPIRNCSPLKFVSCLGDPGAPVRNSVTSAANVSFLLVCADGELCPQDSDSFIRGDANGDGIFDISDPITILTCNFLNIGCIACPDARDANDDGAVDQSDAIYLINWRFIGGASYPKPPAPYPSCGSDTTIDGLGVCYESSCM